MLELETLTKTKVLDVRVLSSKDRKPDEPPGAQLLMQANLSSDALSMLDGRLKAMLFSKVTGKKQGEIEGLESAARTSIGDHIKRLRWEYEQTGCRVTIDRGMGGRSNIELADCKVHRVSISPLEGDSVVMQWTVDAPGLSDATWAKLPGLKSTEIEILLAGPQVDDDDGQQDIESKPAARTRAAAPAPAAAVEPDPAPSPAAAKQPASRRGKGKGPWPFGDQGEDNKPATEAGDATGAFVAAHTH